MGYMCPSMAPRVHLYLRTSIRTYGSLIVGFQQRPQPHWTPVNVAPDGLSFVYMISESEGDGSLLISPFNMRSSGCCCHSLTRWWAGIGPSWEGLFAISSSPDCWWAVGAENGWWRKRLDDWQSHWCTLWHTCARSPLSPGLIDWLWKGKSVQFTRGMVRGWIISWICARVSGSFVAFLRERWFWALIVSSDGANDLGGRVSRCCQETV